MLYGKFSISYCCNIRLKGFCGFKSFRKKSYPKKTLINTVKGVQATTRVLIACLTNQIGRWSFFLFQRMNRALVDHGLFIIIVHFCQFSLSMINSGLLVLAFFCDASAENVRRPQLLDSVDDGFDDVITRKVTISSSQFINHIHSKRKYTYCTLAKYKVNM